ncbi:MAG: hypothetical protein R2824_13380 [Saprospiraceae bacterium]|nr:hypothetical protein [Lewinella sp.]
MLKKYISLKLAAYTIIALLSLLLIFHLVILLGIAPGNMVWGGQLETQGQRLIMEIVAFIFTALMLLMVLVRMDFVKLGGGMKNFSHTAMWVIFVFFVLNFVGNLSSPSMVEKAVFGPIALIMAIFAYRLAMR